MGHPGARSGGVGEGAAIEMCHSGAFTFTYIYIVPTVHPQHLR